MKTFKLTFTFLLVSLFAFSYAQEKPYLVIEDNENQYDVFLKIDNMENIASVDIVGNYTNNGVYSDLAVNIGHKEVAQFKKNVAHIHSIEKNESASSASYMVLLTDKSGEVTSFPLVKVNLNAPTQLAQQL